MFPHNKLLESKSILNQRKNYGLESIENRYRNGEYRIVTEQARYPLSSVVSIFSSINLSPIYQRRRIWSDERKSKLIESFIINVPVPPVFLYEFELSRYEIMDGLQRISTIIEFLNDKFKLRNLDIWSDLNDKYYSELPEIIKDGINRRYISAIILLKETSNNIESETLLKQYVFERLNTGGVSLSPQEIRNALYPSKLSEEIFILARDQIFVSLWGKNNSEEFLRMEDNEMILRFFAYKSACKLSISKPLRKLLDLYASISSSFSNEEVEFMVQHFKKVLRATKHIFGEKAFKQTSTSNSNEKMVFDAITLAISDEIESGNFDKLMSIVSDGMQKKKYQLIQDHKLEVFNGKFTSINNVIQRRDLVSELIRGSIDDNN
ncbi:MAG: DUF262 domain-containing protein [Erysipelotrichaceae bacterium]